MKNVDEIYNESMNEIENYDVDAVLAKVIEMANKETSRKIEEFDIVFENIKKESVGKEKKVKKTGFLKKLLAVFLLVSIVSSLAGCNKDKNVGDSEVTLSPYEQMLDDVLDKLYSEAYNKGCQIGSEMSQKMQNSYYEGSLELVSNEDIVISINDVIDGDNWYEFFSTNLSMLTLDDINSQKYSVAATIYAGIFDVLGEQLNLSENLDEFIENIIGKGIVLEYCEHNDELIYNNVDRELTEEEKISNIELLAKYYRVKARKDSELKLTLN